MTKLIVDTNKCRNHQSLIEFFGSRKELMAVADKVEILVPQIVIDEIKHQKRMSAVRSRDALVKNPLFTILGVEPEQVNSLDVETMIEDSLDLEDIQFKIIDIEDKEKAFNKISNWSSNYEPPFQPYNSEPKGKNSDKGFKDAYIACTIDEIVVDVQEHVVLLTGDDMLAKKYDNHAQVKVARSYEDLPNYIVDAFIDSYLEDKLKEELELQELIVEDSWLNLEDNWVLHLDDGRLVIIDSSAREIIEKVDESVVAESYEMLRDSNSFQQTDDGVLGMTRYVSYLRLSELVELIRVSVRNNQIFWIADKNDVRTFFNTIYIRIKDLLDEDTIISYKKYYKIET